MERSAHSEPSLYHRVVGEAYESLPSVLRRFHDGDCGAVAQGTFRITRGQGVMRQALATLMWLPAPGEHVPILLQVHTEGEAERWTRDFGSHRVVTKQWVHQGLLIESAGPMRVGLRVSADTKGMRFEFARCWLAGVPLPSALAPHVHGYASEYEEGWWVSVRIDIPVLGFLTQYEGKVTPQC